MTFIQYINCDAQQFAWDSYVRSNIKGTMYHLYDWKHVIGRTYKHDTYYIAAVEKKSNGEERIVGVLPLVHLKHSFFGKSLISLPFFDLGGILADNQEIEQMLLGEAIHLGRQLDVSNIELRQTTPFSPDFGKQQHLEAKAHSSSLENSPLHPEAAAGIRWIVRRNKVRMLLKLPGSSEILFKSYKSKLRSQIRKPLKEGLCTKMGGQELLEDFYSVFAVNMRDLGSPVHSKVLMKNVLHIFKDEARIFAVYKDGQAVAAGLVVGYENVLGNPWASSLREFSHFSPNMLLYWTMLEYACDNGYAYFDFGRSTQGEGSCRFKEQWGALASQLFWHDIRFDQGPAVSAAGDEVHFQKAIQYWQKIPVPISKFIGPMLRKHIGL